MKNSLLHFTVQYRIKIGHNLKKNLIPEILNESWNCDYMEDLEELITQTLTLTLTLALALTLTLTLM